MIPEKNKVYNIDYWFQIDKNSTESEDQFYKGTGRFTGVTVDGEDGETLYVFDGIEGDTESACYFAEEDIISEVLDSH